MSLEYLECNNSSNSPIDYHNFFIGWEHVWLSSLSILSHKYHIVSPRHTNILLSSNASMSSYILFQFAESLNVGCEADSNPNLIMLRIPLWYA